MSQTMQPPMMPPGGPIAVPPGAMPNPAFAQWQQAYQQQQAIVAANAQKQAQFDAACALIRKDGVRGFKLDIEADSTIAPDEDAEKQARIEFLQQMVPFMEQVTPIAQGNPEMADLVSQIAMFAVRGFRVARTLEEAFEKAFKVLGTMPPPPPKGGHATAQPDPATEQAKIAADVHDTQTKAATAAAADASKEKVAMLTLAQKQQDMQVQTQLEREHMMAEQQKNSADLMIERERMESSERTAAARSVNTESRAAGRLS